VVLVRLNKVEVGSFALREAVLSVKLELSSDNRVFSPAVHVECSLGKNEDTSISKTVADSTGDGSADGKVTDICVTCRCVRSGNCVSSSAARDIEGDGVVEETRAIDNGVTTTSGA
jgi:hypothetical protein